MVEPDVAPAGGDGRTPAPGRPRDPLGGIKTPREELAGWGGTKGFRSAEASLAQKGAPRRHAGPVHNPGKRGPEDRNRHRWSAERRPHPSQGDAA